MNKLIAALNQPQLRTDLPRLQVGDLVEVYVKIKEGNRERVQMFDGTIISMKNGNRISATFTVRRVAYGVGVEKTFMYNSPVIEKIKVIRHGRVRRAKLYYLRDRVGKAAKVQERLTANAGAAKSMPKVTEEVAESTEE